ncbi:MAG: hypothetical protein M0R80_16955 [Proteobacteria bacterium]|nr:hypothetical protein [Pseudomonadota bacterium]
MTRRSKNRWPRALAAFALAAAALAVGASVLVPLLAPRFPTLLGIDPPRDGATLEIVWRLGGVTAVVLDPLDPPARFDDGVAAPRIAGARWARGIETVARIVADEEVRGASCAAAEDLLGARVLAEALASAGDPDRRGLLSARRCPAVARSAILARVAERLASSGEEAAAAEAYASSELDRAIARARLALVICPWSGTAAAIAGSALLERGVRRYRTGDRAGAAADLDEALGRLTDPDERARALLARGLLAKEAGELGLAKSCFVGAALAAPFHPAAAMARREKSGCKK